MLLAVNLQTSFMHPPFGIALYNLRSVAPLAARTTQIYRGAIPFLPIELLVFAPLIAAPSIVLSSESTPVNVDNVGIPMPPPPARDDEPPKQ